MKTNRNTSKVRAGARKSTKKAKVHPFTEFEGESYTGLRTTETWALGKGVWEEQRTGTQSWDIAFDTIAMKPGKGGMELPVGSEYQTYVLAQQTLSKTRNNTYKVRLEGVKFKLAHRAAGERWNANAGTRRKNLIKILKQVLNDLEMGHGQAPSQTRMAPSPTEAPGQAARQSGRKRKDPRR